MLQQFINQWNGKYVPSRGGITGQCVSLSQAWAEMNGVTGTPVFPVATARQMGGTRSDFFTWIPNTPEGVPQPGDIVVWGNSWGGGAGHTGVVVAANANTMDVFQQNNPTGKPALTKTERYNDCLGWLRLKQGGSMATKVTKETLRMIHSEMEGWPFQEVHAGKFDAQFMASWGGQDLEACMWEKWNKNGAYRNEREAALDFWRNKKAPLEEKVKQVDSLQQQVKSQQEQIQKLSNQAPQYVEKEVVIEKEKLVGIEDMSLGQLLTAAFAKLFKIK